MLNGQRKEKHMAEGHEDNKTDKSTWIWTPNTSYGPFIFGNHLSRTPFVGQEVSRRDMGSGDIAIDYLTTIDHQTELEFWNDKLMSVDSNRSFFQKGTECLFADFQTIKHLFGCEFTVTQEATLLVATCDELDLTIFMQTDWTITSISVGVDPDLYLPPYPNSDDHK